MIDEKTRSYNRAWRAANLERVRAYNHAYYLANPNTRLDRERSHAWRVANLAKARATARAWHARMRAKAIEICGGRCRVCGESDITVLELDHIKGGHAITGTRLIQWVLKRGCVDPPIQVLCGNCHNRKTRADRKARRR